MKILIMILLIVVSNHAVSALSSKSIKSQKSQFRLPPITAPLKPSKNPNYFADPQGKIVYLTGSHTWNTLQDWGTNGSVQPIDFTRSLNRDY
jgi:hypothetical protein